MLQGNEGGNEHARRLRKEMTLPEVMLWQNLRGSPAGLKFRKQHPSGPYIADFYCHKARMIIEVDGMAHDMGDNPVKDELRDKWFAERDLEVVRIPATDILKNATSVSQSLVAYAMNKAIKEHS
jgi:very-short-patch-repair endonuclease